MLMSPTCKSLWFLLITIGFLGQNLQCVLSSPHRILVDTDVDTDDLFGLLYLLKLNKSEFDLVGITISANAWTNAGHGVNQVYDLLHMMGRDDVAVGVGGEGGILDDGTILSDVGGYFPIIEQGMTTTGKCRYRQAVPKGSGGLLDIDANYGFRKQFLPQVITYTCNTSQLLGMDWHHPQGPANRRLITTIQRMTGSETASDEPRLGSRPL